MNPNQRSLWILSLLTIYFALSLSGTRAQDEAAFVEYRQKLMKGVGGNMGAIGVIVQKGLPYKESVAGLARQIQMASALVGESFERKIVEGRTDAKSEIWADWDEFLAAAEKMGQEAGKLAEAAKQGEIAVIVAQMKATGATCRGCHKPFRKPKEESYKK